MKEITPPQCKKHPTNKLDDWLFHNEKGKKRMRCRACRQEIARNHYLKNRENILKKTGEYKRNHPEQYKKYRENEYLARLVKRKKLIGEVRLKGKSLYFAQQLSSILFKILMIEREYEKLKRNENTGAGTIKTP